MTDDCDGAGSMPDLVDDFHDDEGDSSAAASRSSAEHSVVVSDDTFTGGDSEDVASAVPVIEVMVMTCKTVLTHLIDLEALAAARPDMCSFAADDNDMDFIYFRHPLLFSDEDDDLSILMHVFASGKLIIDGCKTTRDAYVALAKVLPIFTKHEMITPKVLLVNTHGIRFAKATGKIRLDAIGNKICTFKIFYSIRPELTGTQEFIYCDVDQKWFHMLDGQLIGFSYTSIPESS